MCWNIQKTLLQLVYAKNISRLERARIMVVKNSIDFGTNVMDLIEKDIKALPQKYRTRFNKETRKPVINFRRRLTRAPARKPAHPFIWSKKRSAQKRAKGWWFAAIAGRIPGVRIPTSGGRYKRTGRMLKKLKVRFDRPPRTITVTGIDINKGGALYTVGPRQVPSHARTPWPRIDKEMERAAVEINDKAIEVWDKITDEVGS
jgi:hypothetical protein